MKRNGRQRTVPRTRRGKAITAHLDREGLTLHQAAARARIAFTTLYRIIHDEPGRQSVGTVEIVCERLGLPLELVAPGLARLARPEPASLAATA